MLFKVENIDHNIEKYLDVNGDIGMYFIDWKNTFDRANWSKIMVYVTGGITDTKLAHEGQGANGSNNVVGDVVEDVACRRLY